MVEGNLLVQVRAKDLDSSAITVPNKMGDEAKLSYTLPMMPSGHTEEASRFQVLCSVVDNPDIALTPRIPKRLGTEGLNAPFV